MRRLSSDPLETMVKRFIAAVPAAFVLFGCAAQTTWVKPGLTKEEFAKDRYSCMQQSQQRVSSAYVDQYGGSSSNHVITNANLFNACMNAQGYTLVKQASLDQAKAAKQASLDQGKAAIDSVKSEVLALCASDDLQPHFSKSPCRPEDTTLEQMSDKSRITNAEKVALSKAHTEAKDITKQLDDIFRQYYPQLAPSLIARRVHANAELDKLTEDFYEGRITRGEYNKRRMEISKKLTEDLLAPNKLTSSGAILIPVKAQGGTYVVPVLINKAITLNFVIDSGSTDVSIPADVVLTLIRSGTLQRSDFTGTQTYRLADGSTVPSATFRIRSLTMNNLVIENVEGSVANVKGDLLLGQSFLSRFKSWSIDNAKQALVLAQ
jgi:predicted aspartyl protease